MYRRQRSSWKTQHWDNKNGEKIQINAAINTINIEELNYVEDKYIT